MMCPIVFISKAITIAITITIDFDFNIIIIIIENKFHFKINLFCNFKKYLYV